MRKFIRSLHFQGLILQMILFASVSIATQAQTNYKGIWQGYISAPGSYNSGYTLHIEEQTADRISGTAYIYRNEDPFIFDGVLDFIGTVDNFAKVTELVILKEKLNDPSRRLCVKLLGLEFTQKDNIDFLTGNWDGSLTDKTPCLAGKVYLRRHNPDNPEGIEPIPDEILKIIAADKSSSMNFLKTVLAKPVIINVRNTIIKLEIRDYLREDLDTVSVYLNRRPLFQKIGIFKKPFKQSFRLDRHSGLNEIILFAENLGQVPPNTSDLLIIDGDRKHRVVIRSTKETSAVVYLRYKPDDI